MHAHGASICSPCHGSAAPSDQRASTCTKRSSAGDVSPNATSQLTKPRPAATHVQASQFVKLARDCQIVGSTLSEADVPLTEADINVTYTAEVTRRDKVAPRVPGQSSTGDRKKMNYNDFLNGESRWVYSCATNSFNLLCRSVVEFGVAAADRCCMRVTRRVELRWLSACSECLRAPSVSSPCLPLETSSPCSVVAL